MLALLLNLAVFAVIVRGDDADDDDDDGDDDDDDEEAGCQEPTRNKGSTEQRNNAWHFRALQGFDSDLSSPIPQDLIPPPIH